jgi:hypothetical protein
MEELVALRSLPAGAGFKPAQAALAKDRCREHWGKSHVVEHGRCELRRRVQANHRSGVESPSDDIKTEGIGILRDKSNGNLFTGWSVSGVKVA